MRFKRRSVRVCERVPNTCTGLKRHLHVYTPSLERPAPVTVRSSFSFTMDSSLETALSSGFADPGSNVDS